MRIIALDDEELALRALLDTIGEAAPGAEIHAFSSAEKALEFAQGYSCDIAFLDIEMSGMSGMELAGQLTARNPEVNIIFVSGHDTYTGDAFASHARGDLTTPSRRSTSSMSKPSAILRSFTTALPSPSSTTARRSCWPI